LFLPGLFAIAARRYHAARADRPTAATAADF
jgi:hypothetical protein